LPVCGEGPNFPGKDEKSEWLGSRDSNPDSMIQSHVSMQSSPRVTENVTEFAKNRLRLLMVAQTKTGVYLWKSWHTWGDSNARPTDPESVVRLIFSSNLSRPVICALLPSSHPIARLRNGSRFLPRMKWPQPLSLTASSTEPTSSMSMAGVTG